MKRIIFDRIPNTTRISIKFQYHKRIIGIIKSVDPSAHFDGQNKYWSGDARMLRPLVMKLKELGQYVLLTDKMAKYLGTDRFGVTPEESERERLWLENHPSNRHNSDTFDEVALGLNEGLNLFGYQRAGVEYIISKNGRGIIADEMGLGKTVQAIALIKYYIDDLPAIIVAPSSLLYNWKKEILTWLPDFNEEDIYIPDKLSDTPKSKITIVSYNYASENSKLLQQYIGIRGILVVDESHNIKNPEASRTVSILELSKACMRSVIMSGTPILNSPIEIWTQVQAVNETLFPDYEEFARRYCSAQMTKYGLDVSGASNLEELYHTLRDEVMVRRLKKDVLTQLPEKIRTTVYITNTNNDVSVLANTLKGKAMELMVKHNGEILDVKREMTSIQVDGDKTKPSQEKMALELYRQTGMGKVDYINEWIIDSINSGIEKIIVFGHHEEFLVTIEKFLNEKDIGSIRIDGKVTDSQERFVLAEKFQNDNSVSVALLSIGAASTGLTLVSANHLIMGEIPMTPGIALQAEDRIHRNGQKEKCHIYYPILSEGVDSALWENMQRKNNISNKMLDGDLGTSIDDNINLSSPLDVIIMEAYHEYIAEVRINSGETKSIANT